MDTFCQMAVCGRGSGWLRMNDQSELKTNEDREERPRESPPERLRRRPEPIDYQQMEIWRRMTPAKRLDLVFQAYQFALEMVRATEQQAHPEMPQEELNWHITRRMQGDPNLGK